tara:strand:+ start:69 stop:803 length:735 start_codon:yes stop_codon:yes gene_type:complete
MIKKLDKISEFKHFTSLANQWWDPKGKFKILHNLTPIRIKYITEVYKNTKNIKKGNQIFQDIDILDLGCGGGLIAEPLARLGSNVTGIDFVKQNIEVAKLHAKVSKLNIKYIHQNLNILKLNKKFDIILVLEVLEHLDNWEKLILNLKKNLKKNGLLIISTINRNIFSKIFAIFFAENILGWIPKNTHNYDKLIKPEELNKILLKSNFNIVNKCGLIFSPISMEWKIKKNNTKINYFCSAIKTN